MPNNNLIPKENLAKVEEVREIEEKELIIPEQQAKVIDYFKERQNLVNNKSKLSPAARSKIIRRHGADYLSERVFSSDIALMQMYGPGFWDDFLRPVTSVALAISYATPFAVVTVPISVGVGVTGAAMATLSDDKDVKNVGCQMLGTVGEAAVSHITGGSEEFASKTKLAVGHIRRNI